MQAKTKTIRDLRLEIIWITNRLSSLNREMDKFTEDSLQVLVAKRTKGYNASYLSKVSSDVLELEEALTNGGRFPENDCESLRAQLARFRTILDVEYDARHIGKEE